MSLRLRFAASAGIAVALVALAMAGGAWWVARAQLRGQVDRSLDGFVHGIADRAAQGGTLPAEGTPLPSPRSAQPGGPIAVIQHVAPSGTVDRPTSQTVALGVDATDRRIASTGVGHQLEDQTVDGIHFRVLTVGAGTAGAYQSARSLAEVDDALDRLLVILAVLGGLGVAAAAGAGALVARTALAPVTRFTARTEAIVRDPDSSHRLEVRGKDELARLAVTFNDALASLEDSLTAQRNLVADASHELRTPIASLRANIQLLPQAARLPPRDQEALHGDIVAELDELTELVANVVELARGSQAGRDAEDVPLDELVAMLVDRFARRAGDGLSYATSLEPTTIRGDPERITRAVSNLLDNAAKWSPPGGLVEVGLQRGELAVRDHGPGFVAEDVPHVFDRFYRAAAARSRPGSGLGLAIVRQAAEEHGGTVEAGNAPDGGAVVRIRFAPGTSRAGAPALRAGLRGS